MFEDEKQLIKIVSRIRFIYENRVGLLSLKIIFDLAIIIRAAIRSLKIINVDDIVSMAENDEIEKLDHDNWIRCGIEIKVIMNSDAKIIHQ